MFYERIKKLRLVLRMNQVQLARELGVTKQSISKWESAESVPSLHMLCKIAKKFHVSADYLLGLDSQNYLDVSDLSMEEIVHIQNIVDDLRKR